MALLVRLTIGIIDSQGVNASNTRYRGYISSNSIITLETSGRGQQRARAYLGWYQHMSPSRLQGLDDLPRFIKESIRTGTPADYYTGAKAAGYPNLFVMGG